MLTCFDGDGSRFCYGREPFCVSDVSVSAQNVGMMQ